MGFSRKKLYNHIDDINFHALVPLEIYIYLNRGGYILFLE